MERLRNLSPRRLQALLADCRSVKPSACSSGSQNATIMRGCKSSPAPAASDEYRRQAALLIRTLPLVAAETLLGPQGRNGDQSLCAQHAASHRSHLPAA